MSENEEKYETLKLGNQLCFPLYACSKEIIRRYKPYLDQIDLTYTQYITMMVMWEMKSVNVKTLGENLYLDSGVREFWLVDPINDEILVYRFEESVVPIRYKFNDRVPVGIYEGKCTVDFKPIMKLVDKWTK